MKVLSIRIIRIFIFLVVVWAYSVLLPMGILFYAIGCEMISFIPDWIKYPAAFLLGHKIVKYTIVYIPYFLAKISPVKELAKWYTIFTSWLMGIGFIYGIWSRFYFVESGQPKSMFIPILSTYLIGFMAIGTTIWALSKYNWDLLLSD